MSIYDFIADGVEESIGTINQQYQRSETVSSNLKSVFQPIADGAWIGQGATAFLQDANTLLQEIDRISAQLNHFAELLNQATQAVLENMDAIDNVIRG
jgi:WXG100 family type VII secretion target